VVNVVNAVIRDLRPMLDAGYWMLDTQHRRLDTGYWMNNRRERYAFEAGQYRTLCALLLRKPASHSFNIPFNQSEIRNRITRNSHPETRSNPRTSCAEVRTPDFSPRTANPRTPCAERRMPIFSPAPRTSHPIPITYYLLPNPDKPELKIEE
jgi:hypothetical protein